MPGIIELTKEQKKAQDALVAYAENPHADNITMGGYAGCGKTTVIAETRRALIGVERVRNVAFCAFTGKAAYVLKSKLMAADTFQPGDYCGTVHGLVYKQVRSKIAGKKTHLYFTKKERFEFEYDLIIVDEASMLNEQLYMDLLSFGRPIIAVGDHGQLPPVKGQFNLMERPQIRLETIHRQVADHPIIKVATMARKYGNIPVGVHGVGVKKVLGSKCLGGMDLSSWMVLCGKNATRVYMNQGIRKTTSCDPRIGDKVICLRNNRADGIFNGMVGYLEGIWATDPDTGDEPEDPDSQYGKIRFDDFTWEGEMHMPQFGQEKTVQAYDKDMGRLFDFGYCLTVHKSQGSESEKVVLIEERFGPPDPAMFARWLYTGVTRAKSELLIIG